MRTPSDSLGVLSAIDKLFDLLTGLPGRSSSQSEQGCQGGLIRPGAVVIVRYVLSALTHHPGLYPDLHDRAPELRERQDRADNWFDLEMLAQGLATYAHQNYLREQSAALTQAGDIIHRVRLTRENPDLLPGIDPVLRWVKIFPAIAALLRQRTRETKLRAKKAVERAAEKTNPASEHQATNERKARGRNQLKADAKDALYQTFRDVLAERSGK